MFVPLLLALTLSPALSTAYSPVSLSNKGLQTTHGTPDLTVHSPDNLELHFHLPGHAHHGSHQPLTCKYWCKTGDNKYYCCPSGEPEVIPQKPGSCPPVRLVCPRTFREFSPPQPCDADANCPDVDKCCFDKCLEDRVCKPPEPLH